MSSIGHSLCSHLSSFPQFVADGVFYAELNELLTRELAEHGYSGVEVRVTPLKTEIIIRATRTQNVLGKFSLKFMFGSGLFIHVVCQSSQIIAALSAMSQPPINKHCIVRHFQQDMLSRCPSYWTKLQPGSVLQAYVE